MTKNVQKSSASEFIEILKLITIFALRRINLQHVLYFTAFLTFALADGITAAYMMEKLGRHRGKSHCEIPVHEPGFWRHGSLS